TWACLATESKVISSPDLSMRRKAATARLRVAAALRWAAAMTWWELSARIGGVLWLVFLDLADHAVEVGQDLVVHLDRAVASLGLGDVDEGERAAALLMQLGQELFPGQEYRTSQASVGVRAAFLERQAAVAVRQGLGGHAVAGLGPLGLGQRPVRVDRYPFTFNVDLRGLLPVAAHGLIREVGVVAGHSV